MNQDDIHENQETADSAPASKAGPETYTATMIRNPYSIKRPTTTITDPPRSTPQPFTSSIVSTSIVTKTTLAESSVHAASDGSVNRKDLPMHSEGPTVDIVQPAANNAGAGSATAATNTSSSSTHTPYWERLPSRNVSFGSAEILTVTECIEHAPLYENRSVRVTGLVHHRSFLPGRGPDDVIIQLELKDPLLILPSSTASNDRSASSTRGRQSSLSPSTRRYSAGNIAQASTPSTSSTTNRVSSSVQLIRQRKRPWFAIGSNSGISNSGGSKGGR